jgi:hypothetical protein
MCSDRRCRWLALHCANRLLQVYGARGKGTAMTSDTEPHGAFVSVNGLRMYVAEQGQGDPLLLVHGGVVDSGMWRGQLPELAAQFRVPLAQRVRDGWQRPPPDALVRPKQGGLLRPPRALREAHADERAGQVQEGEGRGGLTVETDGL